MPRRRDSRNIDLTEVFRRVQDEMLAEFRVGRLFEHASSAGRAAEGHWLEMFDRYLPKRYRAAPAFVMDREGRRSRQIDIAIFDQFAWPVLFPHASGMHLPAESVRAVFEVKPTFSRQWLREAAEKADSVRSLTRAQTGAHPRRILTGLLAAGSVWPARTFAKNLRSALSDIRLDMGCCLERGAFERRGRVEISEQDEALMFFVLRLGERLGMRRTRAGMRGYGLRMRLRED
ncbi:MAG TPA: DUF6602 domain-containing protein [Bryobacteraceae bacterium]|jgi:hypothetical protein